MLPLLPIFFSMGVWENKANLNIEMKKISNNGNISNNSHFFCYEIC